MWDGYRTKEGSKIPDLLSLSGTWMHWHTSGHATPEEIRKVAEEIDPGVIIPMHTESPEKMKECYSDYSVVVLQDGEVFHIR